MKILSFSTLAAIGKLRTLRVLRRLGAVGALVWLSGCATALRIDSDVQTFSSLPAVPPPGVAATVPAPVAFRFERLPLQQATPAQQAGQARLEAMALPALNQVGLVQDEAQARYNVQVSAQLQQVWTNDWNGPGPGWWGPRTSIYYGRGGGGAWWPYGAYAGGGFGRPGFYGYGMYPGWDDRAYQREVSVVLRDVATGQVVYETRAANLGRWPVDSDVLPLMFSAALSGFPQPPAGLRRVNVTVPR